MRTKSIAGLILCLKNVLGVIILIEFKGESRKSELPVVFYYLALSSYKKIDQNGDTPHI